MNRPEHEEREAQALPSIRQLFPEHFTPADAGPSTQLTGASQPSVVQQAPPAASDDDPRKRHVCPTCGKRFQRPSSLRNHLTSHTGARPHECPYPGCGKRFSTRSNMRRHAVVHASPADADGEDIAGSIAGAPEPRDPPAGPSRRADGHLAEAYSRADVPVAQGVQSKALPATRRPDGQASMFATLTLPPPAHADLRRDTRPTRRRSFDSEAGKSET